MPRRKDYVLNCDYHWPAARVDSRHVFQFGGLGSLQPREYHHESERVASFLGAQGTAQAGWNPPEPDGRSAEAEWGFEPALRDDVDSFANEQDYRVRQLSFNDPRSLSRLVAVLYREQYADRGLDTGRLFVQNFTLLDPWWTLRPGSIPYWLPFNASSDVNELERYLEDRPAPFDEIYMTLFSNGIDAAGQASIDRWRDLLHSARSRGEFVGVDPVAYPLVFATYVGFHSALSEVIPSRRPLLPPLSVDAFETFMEEQSPRCPAEWTNR